MVERDEGNRPSLGNPPALLIDLYELTMAQSYLAEGMQATATFSLFVRSLPPNRSYLVAAGLPDVVSYLENLHFDRSDLDYLRSTRLFRDDFLDYLSRLHFHGDLWAMPEGTLFFANEPVLEVTAPIVEAQLAETYLLNQVHFQSLITAKAARSVLAAQGRPVIDFALRRTYGTDAGLKVARDSYLAGFEATSNVLAGKLFGIPIVGTMAHSYIEAFPHEVDSFRAYARTYPERTVLLVDTYDTLSGTRKAALVAHEMERAGHVLRAVRLDSGDAIALSRQVRAVLDAEGLTYVKIMASGGWDEYSIEEAVEQRAPIDTFAVGTKLGVSADAPFSDMAYKLVAYDGHPVAKLSLGKATWPGAKQVYREFDSGGHMLRDVLALREEAAPSAGTPLLVPVMKQGRLVTSLPTLSQARERLQGQLAALPQRQRRLRDAEPFPVQLSPGLRALSNELARRLRTEEVAGEEAR